MTFTVVWVDSTAGELAEIWLSAVDRPLVTAAARDIDQQLRDRIVRVLDVWRIGGR